MELLQSKRGEHYDKDLVEDANNTVEVLLIFVRTNFMLGYLSKSCIGWSFLRSCHGFYLPDISHASTSPK